MNILYLAHRIPYPPNKGDKIRSFHQIKHLSLRHRVFLACFVDDEEDFRYVDQIREHCEVVKVVFLDRKKAMIKNIPSICFGVPLSIASYRSAEMSKFVREILDRHDIDVALVFSSSMAQYVIDVPGIKTVMDFVDVDSFKWRQYSERVGFPLSVIYRLESERLLRYEGRVARSVDASVLVTEAERETFSAHAAGCRLSVIRNGVDTKYFRRVDVTGNASGVEDGGSSRLVFIGAMDYFPNVDAVLYFMSEILPRVWERFPQIEFDVVGRNPTSEVRDLRNRDSRVHVHGNVPDVRPFLQRATVAVAPMRIARGIQNKILEAMAMELPVVVSRDACKGIDAIPGDHLLVADSPEEFAGAIIDLMENPQGRVLMSRKARSWVESRYSWEHTMSDLEILLERVLSGTMSETAIA